MILISDLFVRRGARRLGLSGYARGPLSCNMYYKLFMNDAIYEINTF